MKSYISSLILVAKWDSHQWNCTFIHFNRFEEWIYASREKSRNTNFVIDSSSNQNCFKVLKHIVSIDLSKSLSSKKLLRIFVKIYFWNQKWTFFTNNEHIFKGQIDFSPRSSDRGVILDHKKFRIVKSIISSLNRTFNE